MSLKYKSKFQDAWLVNECFSAWLGKVCDVHSAKCNWCMKSFSISSTGESGLKSHASSVRHQKALAARNASNKLSALFKATPKVQQAVSGPTLSSCSTTSVSNFVTKEETLRAEIIWVLHTIKHHHSFLSNAGLSIKFKKMFPDSEIAKSFGLSERKTAYVTTFGLAPYFMSMLEQSVNTGPFVLLFDESMNKQFQSKQMDFHVRLWDGKCIKTRYLTSKFLGHATAADMRKAFEEATDGLNLKHLIQLSMDGPNVNWSFFDKTNRQLKDTFSMELLNTGSCGLHKVHGACKAAIDSTEWQLDSFLKACHKLFSDTPARREDFVKVSGCSTFPLHFCKHRWLENAKVAQRAIELLPRLSVYVDAVVRGKFPSPGTESFRIVKEALIDVFLPAKLAFFVSLSRQVEPFLTAYQSDKPLLAFMFRDICGLALKVLSRFIKDEIVSSLRSSADFLQLAINDPNIHLNGNKINVGVVADTFLKEIKSSKKASDLKILDFQNNCKKMLCAFMKKLMDKSPLKYKLVKNLSCLDPQVILASKAEASLKLKKVLLELVDVRKFPIEDCDEVLEQFSLFVDSCVSTGSVAAFSRENDSLDVFYGERLADRQYSKLNIVIRQLLLLSHGQASVERGFSINKELEDSNLHERTLVARRVIVDYVDSVGGVDNVEVTSRMLMSAGSAHSRYQQYLENEKDKRHQERQGHKRKAIDEVIKLLSVKRTCLLGDIVSLNKSADEYAVKAEKERCVTHIIHSNSLKKRVREKEAEVKETEKQLDNKLLELKSQYE